MRIFSILIFFMCVQNLGWADRIVLKDESFIEAKIVYEDDQKVQLEFNGQRMTYYRDQIKSINGLDQSKFSISETPKDNKGVATENSKEIKLPEPTKNKRDLILEYINVFGTRESMQQSFKELMATIPSNYKDEMTKLLNVDEVIDRLVPIYDRHFTKEELEVYISFFSSPEGKKFISTLPIVMKEAVDENLEYFQSKLPPNAK